MYSSVASLHIALDARIQQQNSNRKTAIFPQQYDMVLNDAIQTVLKLRLSTRLNPIKIGFEESTNNYDSVKSLKRTCNPTCYYDSVTQRYYFELPSNYYMYASLIAKINYNNTNKTITTKDESINLSILNFDNFITPTKVVSDLKYTTSDNKIIVPRNIYKVGISTKSSFYYFNLIKDYFKNEKDIDCYYENYNDKYYPNSLIFKNKNNNIPINVILNDTILDTITYTEETIINKVIDITKTPIVEYTDMGYKKIDLVSSMNNANDTNDYYAKTNNHLNPKFIMENGKIFLTTDSKFYYSDIRLEYIKQPRIIDSTIGQMTDMEITDDILDIATKLLMATLNIRDPYAEQAAQQNQQRQQNQQLNN